jgi:RES domain-containing protein
VHAFRIGSFSYPLFDGTGAATSDTARWNSRGRHIIYAAEHYATALLEKAAQLNSLKLPRTLVFVRIDVPEDVSVEDVRPEDLAGWDSDSKNVSRAFGDRWYDEQRSAVLLVPSLAAPGIERNVLINQRHPQFGRLTASEPEPLRGHPNLFA